MAYRNKADCIREAERLGIDYEGLSWPELQKAVSGAIKQEIGESKLAEIRGEKMAVGMPGVTSKKGKPVKANKPKTWIEVGEDAIKPFIGQEMLLAPELSPDHRRTIEYVEELGDDYDVEVKSFELGEADIDVGKNYATSTFMVNKRGNSKVRANSALPRENAKVYTVIGRHKFPIVEFKGRTGYLYQGVGRNSVKRALLESGYYEKYKKRFSGEPNVWYAAGLLVCNIDVTNQVLNEIKHEQVLKRERGEL